MKATLDGARVAVASLVLLGAGGCLPLGADALPPMTVERIKGAVHVLRDGEEIPVRGKFAIEPGDAIVTRRSGSASFTLQGPREFRLAGSSEALVESGRRVTSERGGLLASVEERTAVTFGEVEAVTERAVFRVDTGFATARAATYADRVTLTVSGQRPTNVPTFFEALVAANDLPRSARPYRFDPADAWDRLFLDDVMALDDDLTRLADGVVGDAGRLGVDYFTRIEGAPSRLGFLRPYLRRSPSDLLIGFMVARLSAAESEASTPEALRTAFELFDQGGAWGIIAGIMEAASGPLLAQMEDIAGQTVLAGPSEEASQDEGSSFPSSGGSVAGDGDVTAPSGGGDGGGGNQARDPDGGSGGGGGGGSGGGDDECEDAVDCTLQEIGVDPSPGVP